MNKKYFAVRRRERERNCLYYFSGAGDQTQSLLHTKQVLLLQSYKLHPPPEESTVWKRTENKKDVLHLFHCLLKVRYPLSSSISITQVPVKTANQQRT